MFKSRLFINLLWSNNYLYLQILTMNNSTDDFSEYNQVCFCICLILSRWWWYIYPVIIIKLSPSRLVQKIITQDVLCSLQSSTLYFLFFFVTVQLLISVIMMMSLKLRHIPDMSYIVVILSGKFHLKLIW